MSIGWADSKILALDFFFQSTTHKCMCDKAQCNMKFIFDRQSISVRAEPKESHNKPCYFIFECKRICVRVCTNIFFLFYIGVYFQTLVWQCQSSVHVNCKLRNYNEKLIKSVHSTEKNRRKLHFSSKINECVLQFFFQSKQTNSCFLCFTNRHICLSVR